MKTYVALFRGINVGGSHRLPMKDLSQLLEAHGCADVRTYIQSGNAIFCSAEMDLDGLARRIQSAILKRHGFAPRVLLLTRRDLQRAVAANPFPQADGNPTSLHLFFLATLPRKPDLKAMEALKTKTEGFRLEGSVFYLHAPDGFGRSKLAARVEQLLGVEATARNWRTVTTLLDMSATSS